MHWTVYLLIVAFFLLLAWEAIVRYLRHKRDGSVLTTRQAMILQNDRDRLWTRWQWSQDGWVRKDLLTGVLQYGGEGDEPDHKGPIL